MNLGHSRTLFVIIVRLPAPPSGLPLAARRARREMAMPRLPYASDPNDQAWACIAPHVAQNDGPGRKRTVDSINVSDALHTALLGMVELFRAISVPEYNVYALRAHICRWGKRNNDLGRVARSDPGMGSWCPLCFCNALLANQWC